MNEEALTQMMDLTGHPVAFKGMSVKATLKDLVAEFSVEQRYRNDTDTNIEAIYSFPLPLGAVLLGMDVEIGGKSLTGRVVEKKAAVRQYEDAVTDGDSAVMLRESAPGLYTMAVGNLMAGEAAIIRYRYALLLSWQGDRLRLLVPTTIAPRYGNPAHAGLAPEEIPTASLVVDYPFEIEIDVAGALATMEIGSATHPVTTTRRADGVQVRLARSGALDRDFVLTVKSAGTVPDACVLVPDRKGALAYAALRIPRDTSADSSALCLKLVVDCSGSMGGISIAQARTAVMDILDLLRPGDRFNVTLFGSTHRHLFPELVAADAFNIAEARRHLATLDADLGGTEMGTALESAFRLTESEEPSQMILITDGEIWDFDRVVELATASGHRVFSIGVGTSVAEGFVTAIAGATGGAAELVSPQEGMAERVLAQFHRLRQPAIRQLSIDWGCEPAWTLPLPTRVFAGDTVHAFAGFEDVRPDAVSLAWRDDRAQSSDTRVAVVAADAGELPRVAARLRCEGADESIALNLALDYQLLTPFTNYLVVAQRESRAEGLPTIQPVPHMLAAGWGGSASLSVRCSLGAPSVSSPTGPALFDSYGIDSYDIPAFLRRVEDAPTVRAREATVSSRSAGISALRLDEPPKRWDTKQSVSDPGYALATTPVVLLANFARHFGNAPEASGFPGSIADLLGFGLPGEIGKDLETLCAHEPREQVVVAAFILALSESGAGQGIGQAMSRAILKYWKDCEGGRNLLDALKRCLARTSDDQWAWAPNALDDLAEPQAGQPVGSW